MILSTILGLGLLGQVALPGHNLNIDQALAKSRIVVVASPWGYLAAGSPTEMKGSVGLRYTTFLKGESKNDLLVNICTSPGEEYPDKQDVKYVFFVGETRPNCNTFSPQSLSVIKVVPSSPELVAELKGKLTKR